MRRKLMKFGMKHKRFMAAVAGAAMISAAMLPGASAEELDLSNKKELHETAPKAKEARQHRTGDPVRVVRNSAAAFGFDAFRDKFTLLSSSDSKATVQVRSNGQTFKVDLKRINGRWEITTIRGIGDMTRPATYTTVKGFTGNATLGASATAGQMLYQNVNLADWGWYEGAYPKDMSFGLLMKDPRTDESGKIIPDNVANHIKGVNFNQQLVLYAHLGTVAPQGYGIAIERVVKYGHDIVVTLRMKSPRANDASAVSVKDAYITLDRSILTNRVPTNITVYDQNGAKLANYTINAVY